jgi:hypothetical protein
MRKEVETDFEVFGAFTVVIGNVDQKSSFHARSYFVVPPVFNNCPIYLVMLFPIFQDISHSFEALGTREK